MSKKPGQESGVDAEDASASSTAAGMCIHNISMLGKPSFEALAAAWVDHFAAPPVPHSEAFDIIVLGQRLDECVLLDTDGANSAIFRFVGPAVCKRLQGDPTGLDLLQLIQQFPFKVSSIIHEMMTNPVGLHAVYEMSYMSGRKTENQGLYLPLIANDSRPNQIIGMQSAGSTLLYDAQPPQAVEATNLISLTWVDLGAGVPSAPPQFEAG